MDEIKLSLEGIEGISREMSLPSFSGYATIKAEYKSLKTSFHKFVKASTSTSRTDIMRQPKMPKPRGQKLRSWANEYKKILGSCTR
jgi:hypothetical protein